MMKANIMYQVEAVKTIHVTILHVEGLWPFDIFSKGLAGE